jgi:alpha-galactosidase
MGNDMSKLIASDYSILANPAVIAVNQDPLGIAATYRWTKNNVQLWSGPLVSTSGSSVNDQVVALYNNGGSSTTVSVSFSDIFGSSSIPSTQFEIRDLWGSRLSNSQAQTILTNGAAANPSWLYNATAKSYASGLAQGDSMLLGTSIGSVTAPSGSISASVPGDGCRILRLRAVSGSSTSSSTLTSTTSSTATTTSPSQSLQTHWGQCGGQGWTGPTQCQSPYTCQVENSKFQDSVPPHLFPLVSYADQNQLQHIIHNVYK